MACGSLDEIIQNFNALAGEDVSEWTRQTSQYLIDHRVPEIKWIEGMTDALDTLKDAGYQIGILTSDTKKEQNNSLKPQTQRPSLILLFRPKPMPQRNPIQKCCVRSLTMHLT